jgi:hypothetical protein
MNHKFVLIILCCLLLNCSKNQQTEQNIIIVKVPPIYDEKLSREENYYRFQHFLFPQLEIPSPIPKVLPNDDSVLFVTVDESGKLKLNLQETGNVLNTNPLTTRLAEIFLKERKMAHMNREIGKSSKPSASKPRIQLNTAIL